MIAYRTMRPFLVPARKGPKESGTGEALTAKPIRTTFINHHFSPASSRPPLCTPSGASRNIYYGHNNLSQTSAVRSVRNSVSTKTDPHQCIDRGRVGVWGRAAQSRGTIVSLSPQKRKTLRPAHPPADFFGYFLVQRQESNIPLLR